MPRYRKKPVVVEATQWCKNGDHPEDHPPGTDPTHEGAVVRYFRHPDISGEVDCHRCGVRMHDHGWIDTIQGGHIVCPGDYIITDKRVKDPRDRRGHYYPCKPDIFEATYEPAALNIGARGRAGEDAFRQLIREAGEAQPGQVRVMRDGQWVWEDPPGSEATTGLDVGDVVRLWSDPMRMTVESAESEGTVSCAWFTATGELRRERFSPRLLVRLPREV